MTTDGPPEHVWEQLVEKADFCLTTGIPPSEYDQMTDDERAAFVHVANKRAKRKG